MAGCPYFRCCCPPLNRKTLVRHYMPAVGVVSYGGFAVHTLSPRLLYDLFPRNHLLLANAMLFNCHLGIGLYVYYRAHMKKVSKTDRVMYTVFVTVLFNFGSILLWASTKPIVPRHVLPRAIFGALTSFALIAIGREYLKMVDTLAPAEPEEPDMPVVGESDC